MADAYPRSLSQYDDEDLVSLALQVMQEPAAARHSLYANEPFDELVKRHCDSVKKAVKSRVGSSPDLDDIVQTSFMKAYYSLDKIKDGSRFKYWVRMIAVNEASSFMRSSRPAASIERALTYPEYANSRIPADIAEATLLLEKLHKDLPEQYMRVLYLRYYLDYTVNEVAELLEIDAGLVKWRTHRAKQLARGLLEEEGDATG